MTSAVRVRRSRKNCHVLHFANLVEIEIRDDERVFIARRFRDKLPARIAEVTLSVKLADVPRLFVTDAIDRADEIAIRNACAGCSSRHRILKVRLQLPTD